MQSDTRASMRAVVLWTTAWLGSGMLAVLLTVFVHAQDRAPGRTAGESELDSSIRQHHERMFRMTEKFQHGWYLQGALPPTFRSFGLADLKAAIHARSTPKQPMAVLFYSYSASPGRLNVWLIGDQGKIAKTTRRVTASKFETMRPRLLSALGAVPPGRQRNAQEVRGISEDLVPPEILRALMEWKLERMVVVPIFDLGEMPYAALAVDDSTRLMDIVRITIAPGFFVFRDPARTPGGSLEESVIAAYEGNSEQLLRHARIAAEGVKALLGAKGPVLDRHEDVAARLRSGAQPRFVFIAAHGVSNTRDPVDGGKVDMADGPWNGRAVSFMRERDWLKTHPIVVLSACESGTGKMFEVGSIGLSRAWYYAGASGVVASLWRVDELETRELMTTFVEMARSMPAQEALWAAMKAEREKGDDPMNWAAFSVFGPFTE